MSNKFTSWPVTGTSNPLVPAGGTQDITGAVSIDGSADVVQLTVQSHSEQTALPFVVEDSAGTDVFTVSNTGAVVATGAGTFGNYTKLGDVGSQNELLASIADPETGMGITSDVFDIRGGATNGAAAVAIQLSAWNNLTTAGAKIVSFGDNAGSSFSEKAYIDLDGVVTASGFKSSGNFVVNNTGAMVPVDGTQTVTGSLTATAVVRGTYFAATDGNQAITVAGAAMFGNSGANSGAMLRGSDRDEASGVGVALVNHVLLTAAGAKLVSIRNTTLEKAAFMLDGALLFTPTALALGASPHTALPVGGIVEVTCESGAQTWTITETGATNGEIHHIVNVGSDALTIDHVAGQVLLNGGADVVLGQYDALTIYYSAAASAWIQLGATSNN